MPYGIEAHHLYMLALMLVVFAIGFLVLSVPKLDNELGALMYFALIGGALFIERQLLSIHSWNDGAFGIVLSLVAYTLVAAVGLIYGHSWRNKSNPHPAS